jgi:hypothetical protein
MAGVGRNNRSHPRAQSTLVAIDGEGNVTLHHVPYLFLLMVEGRRPPLAMSQYANAMFSE